MTLRGRAEGDAVAYTNIIMTLEQVQINILYFAAASTATGLFQESIHVPPNLRLSHLGNMLVARHPKATDLQKILDGSQWSVDAEMVDDPEKVELKGGEEVAIICPVSGG